MHFLTDTECRVWCATQSVELNEKGAPVVQPPGLHCLRFALPKTIMKLVWFAQYIEASLKPRTRCLLWVTEWGVWPSSENWHLYYRLRQSYGDRRLLDEAPGHLFLPYEAADLISFLQVGLIAGWDMYLLPSDGYGRAFASHDEWVALALEDASEIHRINTELTQAGVLVLQ